MKSTMRIGTFETNSSSTHSLIYLTAEQFEKWKDDNNLYVNMQVGVHDSWDSSWDALPVTTFAEGPRPPVDTAERPAFIDQAAFERWCEQQKSNPKFHPDACDTSIPISQLAMRYMNRPGFHYDYSK